MKKRLISALLALVMVVSMIGCNGQTPETTDPGPQAADIYNEARTQLEAATAVTMDVKLSSETVTEGQTFATEETQVVTYGALDTDSPVIQLTKDVTWSLLEEEDEDDAVYAYTEIYSDDTLFVEMEDLAAFTGSVNPGYAEARFVPVALLDAALYTDITMQTQDAVTTVNFSGATAPESWAAPADAQLEEASGTAVIENGALQTMTYTVTYTYGTTEITYTAQTTIRAEAEQVTVPADTERYSFLEGVEALPLMLETRDLLQQAKTAHVNYSAAYGSQAAGVAYTLTNDGYFYDLGEKPMAKTKDQITYMDLEDGTQSMEQESVYKDGKVTITSNGGLPASQSVKDSEVLDLFEGLLTPGLPMPNYWKDATITDLGGVLLVEFGYTDDFGENTQSSVNELLFGDISFLNSYASSYETREVTGYVSLDSYTGLVLACGMNYEGCHVIDGDEYLLTMELTQKIEAPAFGAYEEITGEKPAEETAGTGAKPLFYRVTGQDGQEMWLFGTIHVGDARTASFPQEIYDAFAASDALALEFDSEAFLEQLETDPQLQAQLALAYFYTDGSTLKSHVDAEVYDLATMYMKASGNYSSQFLALRAGWLASEIDNFYLRLSHALHAEQGVEKRLTQLAKEQNKPIRNVESGLEQMQMTANWSEPLQEILLEDAMGGTVAEYSASVLEMYELWCAGDEAALREYINEDPDTSEMTEEELAEYNAAQPLREEYENSMEHTRNAKMLQVAKDYLNSGDVVFYAVGLAHLLNEETGLVNALREAGYTVELVTYSE